MRFSQLDLAMLVPMIVILCAVVATASYCSNCSISPDLPCRCDSVCSVYNDCCPNYDGSTSDDIPHHLREIHHLLQCESVLVSGDEVDGINEAYYMISNCTADGSSCGESVGLPPVTDVSTRLTYRNMYCAVCSGVSISSVVVWSTVLVCDDVIYDNVTIEVLHDHCSTCSYTQDTIEDVRWCIPTVDDCDTQQYNCTNGHYDPVTANNTVYRNSYCAQCNGHYTQDCFTLQSSSIGDRCGKSTNRDGVLIQLDFTLTGDVIVTGDHVTQTVLTTCEAEQEIFDLAQLQCVRVMCPLGQTLDGGVCQNRMNKTVIVIVSIGCAFSLLWSIMILLTYFLFKELRNLPSKLLMGLVATFLLNDLLVLLSTLVSPIQKSVEACSTVAIILHMFFLCRFMWATTLGIEYLRIIYSVRRVSSPTTSFQNRMLALYSMLGWGVPLSIVLINVAVTYSLGTIVYGLNEQTMSCWLVGSLEIIVAAIVPMGILSFFNILLFVSIIYLLYCSKRRSHSDQYSTAKQLKRRKWVQLRAALAIFVILGMAGILNISSSYLGTNNIWVLYTFLVLNSLQPFVVFIAFLCSKRVGSLYLVFLQQQYNLICSRWRNRTPASSTTNPWISDNETAGTSCTNAHKVQS